MPGEISITSDMQVYFNDRKLEEVNSLLMKVKELKETGGLKLSIQKAKIMASGSNHFMENR